jgi:hypothetical protein
MGRRRKGSLTPVGSIARGVLGDKLWEKARNRELLHRVWQEVVGEFVARHSEVKGVKGEALVVQVDDHALMNNLQLMSPGIIKRINDEVEGKMPPFKKLYLRWGEVECADPKQENPMPKEYSLTPQQEARVEEIVKDIADPELREITRRLITKSFAKKSKEG